MWQKKTTQNVSGSWPCCQTTLQLAPLPRTLRPGHPNSAGLQPRVQGAVGSGAITNSWLLPNLTYYKHYIYIYVYVYIYIYIYISHKQKDPKRVSPNLCPTYPSSCKDCYPNGSSHHGSRCRGSNLIGVDRSARLLAEVVLRRSGVVFF